MAVRYVNPNSAIGGNGTTDALSGGNHAYISLSAAEAALPASFTEPWEIICETGGNADTSRVTISGGYTVTATNYLYIHTSSGHAHAGVWDAAKYRLAPTTGTTSTLTINEDFVRIEGLQIESIDSNGVIIDFLSGISAKTYINRCIVRSISGGTIGVHGRAGTTILTNSIIYGFSSSGITARNATAATYAYNCTLYSNAAGTQLTSSGVITARNCVSWGNTGSDFSATSLSHCVSEDASAGTSNGCKNNQTLTSGVFTDYTSRDFTLLSTDTVLKDAGEDLSTDPDSLSDWTGFSDDAKAGTRSGTWDIGALEYVAAGGSTLTPASTSLSFSAQTSSLAESIPVAAASLSFSAATPTVTQAFVLSPSADSLTLSAATPSLTGSVAPSAASLSFSAQTSTLTETLAPVAGSLSLTAATPAIGEALSPGTASLTLSAGSSALTTAIAPAAGSLTLTAETPNIGGNGNLFPAAAALSLTGESAALTQSIPIAAGSLGISAATPTVSQGLTLSPAAASVSITAAFASLTTRLSVDAGVLVLTGFTSTVTTGSPVFVPSTRRTNLLVAASRRNTVDARSRTNSVEAQNRTNDV